MITEILAAGIILLNIGLLLATVVYLLDRFTGLEVLGRFEGVVDLLSFRYREIGFILASFSTLGSLYLSKIAGLEACELCWYQRILIFPIPVILAVALVLDRRDVSDYVLSLAALGIPISVYHYLIQMTSISYGCSTAVSCDTIQVQQFGFVTVPWMSMTFFLSTVLLMLLGHHNQ